MRTVYVVDLDEDRVVLRGSRKECEAWCYRHNAKVVDSGGGICFVIREEHEVTNWDRDDYQFPRLIAEIAATQDKLDIQALCEVMDLDPGRITELFERAHDAWERVKRETT